MSWKLLPMKAATTQHLTLHEAMETANLFQFPSLRLQLISQKEHPVGKQGMQPQPLGEGKRTSKEL